MLPVPAIAMSRASIHTPGFIRTRPVHTKPGGSAVNSCRPWIGSGARVSLVRNVPPCLSRILRTGACAPTASAR